ncbi:hypothetical protein C8R45DRAFT_1090424 [Mycena sanguinolenta]|nr:hypothetical protein C8R45DRAFT_1090424 [Mycena sanguinolenta]
MASLPAALKEARGRREQAYDAFRLSMKTGPSPQTLALAEAATKASEEAHALRIAANAAATPVIRDILAHYNISHASADLDALVSAMHRDKFALLAQLGDSAHFSCEGIFALRSAWHAHHRKASHMASGPVDDQVALRILACSTFGDVAGIIEDELHLPDPEFKSVRQFWRFRRGMLDAAPNGALCDAFENLILFK